MGTLAVMVCGRLLVYLGWSSTSVFGEEVVSERMTGRYTPVALSKRYTVVSASRCYPFSLISSEVLFHAQLASP